MGGQTHYERQKNAEEMFDATAKGSAAVSTIIKRHKLGRIPILKSATKGLDGIAVGSIFMKHLVSPDEFNGTKFANDYLKNKKKIFHMTELQ